MEQQQLVKSVTDYAHRGFAAGAHHPSTSEPLSRARLEQTIGWRDTPPCTQAIDAEQGTLRCTALSWLLLTAAQGKRKHASIKTEDGDTQRLSRPTQVPKQEEGKVVIDLTKDD